MEKRTAKVVTLDSDSEDELQILSENITNYGNYSTPVEIAPELQEKIKMSLEKRASLPGKIKTIKVYATKRNNQELSSVRASFRPSNGQPTQTIDVGHSFNELFSSRVFSNQVRGGGNNNSIKGPHVTALEKSQKLVHYSPEPPQKRSKQPALDDAKGMANWRLVQKRSQQPSLDDANGMATGRPLTPSSPVILYSPIRKRKTPQQRDHTGQTHLIRGFQQTFTHPPKNSDDATPPLIPRRENFIQENSKTIMKTSVEFKVNIKVTPNLTLNDLKVHTTRASLNLSESPVKLSPVRFSSDDEELFVEDSILGIWNSPMPSPHRSADSFLNFEKKSPSGKVNDFDYIEDAIEITEDMVDEEETFHNSQPEDLMSEVGEELDDKVYKVGNKINIEKEKEKETNRDDEAEIIIKDVNSEQQFSDNDKFVMSRCVKINVETLPKRFLESRSENGGNDEHSFPNVWPQNEENGRPLWTTIFPPNPPSPPPQSWMKSAALWDLDAGDFRAITGLCGLETAKEIKRKLNAPKPLVRVLRKRHK